MCATLNNMAVEDMQNKMSLPAARPFCENTVPKSLTVTVSIVCTKHKTYLFTMSGKLRMLTKTF
jgi:hypothetical protein